MLATSEQHRLQEIRGRLDAGGSLTDDDAKWLLGVVERLDADNRRLANLVAEVTEIVETGDRKSPVADRLHRHLRIVRDDDD